MILHIDMDAFYASIEQRDHPEYRGRPVIVGGSTHGNSSDVSLAGGRSGAQRTSGRGVVCAASYEARRFGVHSAMSGSRARQLCPDAVFVRTRMDHYVAVGRQVREIFHRFTPLVQPLSCDEAFLDIGPTMATLSKSGLSTAADVGRAIKDTISRELNLTASVGIAPMKFVAKIASDLNKPDGFIQVTEDGVIDFLDPLPVERLWGVGKVGVRKLHRLGLRRMVDIRTRPATVMEDCFGSWGVHLWRLANGIDPRPVETDRNAKQISHERTFHNDIDDAEMLDAVVHFLSAAVARRLRRNDRLCRGVTLKYRRDDFKTFARSHTFAVATDSTDAIADEATKLMHRMRRDQPRPVRLIGVSATRLSDRGAKMQMALFDEQPGRTALRKVDSVMDAISDDPKSEMLYRATSHRFVKDRRQRREDRLRDRDDDLHH